LWFEKKIGEMGATKNGVPKETVEVKGDLRIEKS
jgi:hypothetical protein